MKRSNILKRIGITLLTLGLLCVALFLVYKIFFDPYRGTVQTFSTSLPLSDTLTKAEAIEDLSYIMDKLEERHPACMDGIPIEVQEQYEIELSGFSESITTLELWQASARILNHMKDAHTSVGYNGEDTSYLNLTFTLENKELYCSSESFEDYIVHTINGIPWQDLYQTYLGQFSYELENYAAYCFGSKLPKKSFLEFVGIDTSSDITISFLVDDLEQEVTFSFEALDEEIASVDPTAEEVFVSYEIDNEHSLGILTLLSCNYNDKYCETVKHFFIEVKVNNIENVVVDLRGNGGGNSMVANEFLRYIDIDEYYVAGGVDVRYGSFLHSFQKSITKNNQYNNLVFTGALYALTSDETFSSAKMFANIILDNHLGELIGEIPGNMPASYGDILLFQTPNAKLKFTISYKYFGRIDGTKAALPLLPDYEVKSEDALTKLYELVE